MKKVCIMPNWGMTSLQLMDEYKKLSPNQSMKWNDFILTNEAKEADFQIVMDGSEVVTDPKKVIFFGREPTYIGLQLWPETHCLRRYHHELKNSWNGITWWLKSNFDELITLKNFKKEKNLSSIDSGKYWVDGHRMRVKLINSIANEYPEDIEIWGYITKNKENNKPYITSLPHKQKDLGLMNYRYNLAIENGDVENYFSEKFADPLLCWTMPIYWGCSNLEKFFPSKSFVRFDINDKFAKEKIIEISKSNIREENLGEIEEARHLILTKYNLFPTIELAINNTLSIT